MNAGRQADRACCRRRRAPAALRGTTAPDHACPPRARIDGFHDVTGSIDIQEVRIRIRGSTRTPRPHAIPLSMMKIEVGVDANGRDQHLARDVSASGCDHAFDSPLLAGDLCDSLVQVHRYTVVAYLLLHHRRPRPLRSSTAGQSVASRSTCVTSLRAAAGSQHLQGERATTDHHNMLNIRRAALE